MIFDIITIFPEFFDGILEHGLLKRARSSGHADIRLHDLRDATEDRHRTVDDRPFGGGPGMVFKPEPLFRAVEALKMESGATDFPVILLSPQGRLLTQAVAEELSRQQPRLILICGRYEGVDERVATHLVTDEISIGDFVLSGGELAAAVLMESVTRLLPGVLGNEASRVQESFAPLDLLSDARDGLLDFPQYTRPADFGGLKVPEVLLSGNHEEIREWRRRQSLEKTWRRRPDLLAKLQLSLADREIIEEVQRAALEPAVRSD
jgi:tRNA (guanine37-N1)-methyltransferase